MNLNISPARLLEVLDEHTEWLDETACPMGSCDCGWQESDGKTFLDHLRDEIFAAAEPASADGQPVLCRTYSTDGLTSLCDKPARYIVWGHLYDKLDKGPKCYAHVPKPTNGHDGIVGDYVVLMPHGSIYEIPTAHTATSAAADAVLALHAPTERSYFDEVDDIPPTCVECRKAHPCPTVLAVTAKETS